MKTPIWLQYSTCWVLSVMSGFLIKEKIGSYVIIYVLLLHCLIWLFILIAKLIKDINKINNGHNR